MHSIARSAATVFTVAAAFTLSACTSSGGATGPAALGRVPIPTAPATPIIPTARVGHAQLVSAGDTVLVDLPDGSQALATVSGPSLDVPTAAGAAPLKHVTGKLTVKVVAQRGAIPLDVTGLVARDDLDHVVKLSADHMSATATPNHPAVILLTGVFQSGDTSLTWNAASGRPLATWDFQVEVD
jgi:hypothetical protein